MITINLFKENRKIKGLKQTMTYNKMPPQFINTARAQ